MAGDRDPVHGPGRGRESHALPDDPLSALDVRIAVLRGIRAAAPRFGEAFWEADDALTWLRVARDEFVRTGRIRDEVMAFLEAPPSAIMVETDALESPVTGLSTVVHELARDAREGASERADAVERLPIVAA